MQREVAGEMKMAKTLTQSFLTYLFAALLLAGTLAAAAPVPGAEDTLAHARDLAFSGKEHRAEALQVLERRLADSPGDNDARTFYGTVLSWEGRYDDARKQLTQVLQDHPYHSDALPALINVELWSDHPEQAEQLARDGLTRDPKNTGLMLQLARAQRNERRYRESVKTLDSLLLVEPNNPDARKMRRNSTFDSWKWEAGFTHTTDFLSGDRDSQYEDSLQLRGGTAVGSLIGRWSHASHFGFASNQFEVDMYPHIRPGTYMYLNFGASPDHELYPEYRLGADLYQSLHHGFEISGGYRRLKFVDSTNIFTWSVSKYYGDWLFSGRMYHTPDELGVSNSVQLGARRFFGGEGTHDYVEVKFSTGSSLAVARTALDVIGLRSTRVTLEGDKSFGHWALNGKFGVGSEEQTFGTLKRYTAQGSLYYRF
jgi:YaiO family outer membrane protein